MATAYTPLRRGTHRRGSRSCVQPALAHSPVQASTLALNRVLVSPTGFHGGGLAEKSGRDRCTRRTDQMVAPPTLLFGQKGAAGLIWPVERRETFTAAFGLLKSLKSCRTAAAHGRGALALLRAPVRARCLARHACSGASRTSQKRRPATCSERSRPALAAEARQKQQNDGGGRQCRRRGAPGPRADGAVASHRAADGAVPSIEAARTYARGTSRGAVARFARA